MPSRFEASVNAKKRKELKRQARRLAEEGEVAVERETAADLSHRLRTPATALRLDADLVADDDVADRMREHVEMLHRAIDSVVRDHPAYSVATWSA